MYVCTHSDVSQCHAMLCEGLLEDVAEAMRAHHDDPDIQAAAIATLATALAHGRAVSGPVTPVTPQKLLIDTTQLNQLLEICCWAGFDPMTSAYEVAALPTELQGSSADQKAAHRV